MIAGCNPRSAPLGLRSARPVLMPKYAGRCLKPAQDRGPELPDKCSILALDPLAAFGGLDCDGIGIDELAVACVTGHAGIGHGHPLACGNATTDRLTISSADLC